LAETYGRLRVVDQPPLDSVLPYSVTVVASDSLGTLPDFLSTPYNLRVYPVTIMYELLIDPYSGLSLVRYTMADVGTGQAGTPKELVLDGSHSLVWNVNDAIVNGLSLADENAASRPVLVKRLGNTATSATIRSVQVAAVKGTNLTDETKSLEQTLSAKFVNVTVPVQGDLPDSVGGVAKDKFTHQGDLLPPMLKSGIWELYGKKVSSSADVPAVIRVTYEFGRGQNGDGPSRPRTKDFVVYLKATSGGASGGIE